MTTTDHDIPAGVSSTTSRLIPASPAQVFAAFADPVRLARWWGPAGFTNSFEQFDLRPGGRWRLVMHGPDGTDYPNEMVFVEVLPERVVVEHLGAHHFVLNIRFAAHGEAATLVGWHQRFDSPADYQALAAIVDPANEQNLDRLAAEVARSAASSVSPKDIAVEFLQQVSCGQVEQAYAQHVAPDFRHHNPWYAGDAASLRAGMMEHAATHPHKTLTVERVLQDGALVAVHSRVQLQAGAPGWAVVHIFRFEGARIAELWDIGQAEPDECINQFGMF